MAVVETPVVTAAAWPSAMATLIVAVAQPEQVLYIGGVVASVTVGVMLRRAWASARGIKSVALYVDLITIAPLTIITLISIRALHLEVSWQATVAMALVTGNGGVALARRWLKDNEAGIPLVTREVSAVITPKPTPVDGGHVAQPDDAYQGAAGMLAGLVREHPEGIAIDDPELIALLARLRGGEQEPKP